MKPLLFQWAVALLLPIGLLAQKPKTPVKTPVQTVQNADPKIEAEVLLLVKSEIEKLKSEGKSSVEITRLLKDRKLANNRTISQKDLLRSLRQTTGTPRPVNPTAPPPPTVRTMGEDEIEDAAEIVRCFAPGCPNGVLTNDLFTMIVEEFDIPSLAALLTVLDRAGEFIDAAHGQVGNYFRTVAAWVAQGQPTTGSLPAASFPAPNWLGQFDAFAGLFAQRGEPAPLAFYAFLDHRQQNANRFPRFLSEVRAERVTRVLASISAAYGLTQQQVLRAGIEAELRAYRNNEPAGVRNFIRGYLSTDFPAQTATFWAQVFKLEDGPAGTQIVSTISSTEATTFLLELGYPNAEVLAAIRAVYQ